MIRFQDRELTVFTVAPRILDDARCWPVTQDVIRWSDTHGFSGILIFTGNDTLVDPWLVAQTVLTHSSHLTPLVAVNPVFMHPFTAAKMVTSLAYMHGRRLMLNMVTGTALSYLHALGDRLEHDQRYERLQEYITILRSLLAGPGLSTFQGSYYQVSDLQLFSPVPPALMPGFLLAGHSEAARRLRRDIGALGLEMLDPSCHRVDSEYSAIHFGIIARPTQEDAWNAARRHFPDTEEGRQVLDISMRNTDSEWKRKTRAAAQRNSAAAAPGYWLGPFENFQADSPYFVGSYAEVAEVLARLADQGIDCFIIDLPAAEEEFGHLRRAFSLVSEALKVGA